MNKDTEEILKNNTYSVYNKLKNKKAYSKEDIEQLFYILKDPLLIRKVLGRNSEDSYINNERLKMLLKLIPFSLKIEDGFLLFHGFTNDIHNTIEWSSFIMNIIEEVYIDKILSINYEIEKNNSFIYNLNLNNNTTECDKILITIRNLIEDKNVNDNFLEAILKAVIYEQCNYKYEILSIYYIGHIYISLGKNQIANNLALTILKKYEFINEEEDKKLCLYLFLLLWGTSQYKIGNTHEGIICVLSSIDILCEIKNKDVVPFLENGLRILSMFILDINSLKKIKNLMKYKQLYDHTKKYNLTLSNGLGIIFDIENIMSKLENRIKNNNILDKNFYVDIINYINILTIYKKNDEILSLISKYKKEILESIDNRKDIKHIILLNLSQIFYHHRYDNFKYKEIIEFMDMAIDNINDIRNELYHKEEKASLYEISSKIYNFYIEVCIEYVNKNLIYDEEELSIIEEKIIKVMGLLYYRTIIEKKYFNFTSKITKDMQLKYIKYNKLEKLYHKLKTNKYTDLDILEKIVIKIEKLQNELKKEHYNFKPLSYIEHIDLYKIKEILNNNEVLYQVVLLNNHILSVIVDNNNLYLDIYDIDKNKINNINDNFYGSYNINDFNEIVNLLSNSIKDYLNQNNKEILYLNIDIKFGHINLSSKYNELKNIKSIINIMDYNILNMRNDEIFTEKMTNVYNSIHGKNHDEAISIISKFVSKHISDNFFLIEDIYDYNYMKNISNSLILYGHGFVINDYAIGIADNNSLLNLDKILLYAKNVNILIIISCSSGIPSNLNPENIISVWNTILENYIGQIILCRWDVDANKTVELLEKILSKLDSKPLSEALFESQIEMSKNNSFMNWGGLEFWIN